MKNQFESIVPGCDVLFTPTGGPPAGVTLRAVVLNCTGCPARSPPGVVAVVWVRSSLQAARVSSRAATRDSVRGVWVIVFLVYALGIGERREINGQLTMDNGQLTMDN